MRKLKHLIRNGSIVRMRPKGGTISYPLPQIDIPHFAHGDTGEGIGRGPGKEGDVIKRDPKPGQGQGAGEGEGEGLRISVDMEDVLKFMEDELKLPRMKPKPIQTFRETKVKYNDISRTGPESLRHPRRTMKEAIKRMASAGELGDKDFIITPINSDRRYRQFRRINIPSSNAVIFFARDCSGSMDDYRCDVVSDMAWWLDTWIRRFYKRVDRCYFVHDARATEVSEEDFYATRMMGGTMCSSAFDAVADQLVNRYQPQAFNIYFFYFTDGQNLDGDNDKVLTIMKERLGPEVVNLIGIAQICPYSYGDSVKKFIDDQVRSGSLHKEQIRTTQVGEEDTSDDHDMGFSYGSVKLSEEERNQQILEGIRKLLGTEAERQ